MGSATPQELVAAARVGDRGALARVLSLVERGGDAARELGRITHSLSGGATTVGVTGAPGAGKSTLTSALLRVWRSRGERVAVLAIDPSSPFSGGAILGDRVRMGDHVLDDGVFIRSMATRGHLGGLSLAVPEAARALDAAGYDRIIIETVGVGQVEVEVAAQADTVVVVVNPGWGDAVQANKAGLMEIADVFALNKADRPGADETRRDLTMMLHLSTARAWTPPVVCTSATADGGAGTGAEELVDAIEAHHDQLARTGELAERRRRRERDELHRIITERLRGEAERLGQGETFERLAAQVADRTIDPWSAADALLRGSSELRPWQVASGP